MYNNRGEFKNSPLIKKEWLNMGKITKKKFDEYKAINENGFMVDVTNWAYGYTEYPTMAIIVDRFIVQEDQEQIQYTLEVELSYRKTYNGGVYRIKAYEKKIQGNMTIWSSQGYFQKSYYEEITPKSQRFSMKTMRELCHKLGTVEEIKAMVEKDYAEYKAQPLEVRIKL
jgi:hypothetical protein